MNHPAIEIVCDHGIRGGSLDRVARFEWMSDGGYWYLPNQFTPAETVSLVGDEPQHTAAARGNFADATRNHYEIPCPKAYVGHREVNGMLCTRREYRADGEKLQNILDLIGHDDRFRIFTVSADESQVVVTLDALHKARDTAKDHLHLLV